MGYQIYYPAGCGAQVPDHFCDPCGDIENGRIRSVAFIADDFTFVDPTNPVEWAAGVAAKKIIIIAQTNGSFDGGSEILTPGYGDMVERLVGYNFTATYKDPDYGNNADFYNGIKLGRGYKFAYRTSSKTHITEVNVQVIPKNPVAEEPTSEVVWEVLVKWADDNLPVPFNTPANVFVCYDYTGTMV